MLGNPFSGAYARGRLRGAARPLDYCALNVALYGPTRVWSLEERALRDDARAPDRVALGASVMRYEGDALVVDIDERTTPFGGKWGGPLRGRIVFRAESGTDDERVLDEAARHRWWPVAPMGRIEVALDTPNVRFGGHGYHDANAGDVPLEETFSDWSWARARGARKTFVAYEARERGGSSARHVLSFGHERSAAPHQDAQEIAAITRAPLPRSAWRLPRASFADEGTTAHLVRSLEDGPFYARDLVRCELGGERVVAMHETLSCTRLARSWVRFLAQFRAGRSSAHE